MQVSGVVAAGCVAVSSVFEGLQYFWGVYLGSSGFLGLYVCRSVLVSGG